jgi:twitching motility protein PilT
MQIDDLLALAVERSASDLHLSCGHPPLLRIDGELQALARSPLTGIDMDAVLAVLAPAAQQRGLSAGHGCDFAVERPAGARFRASAFVQHHGPALALRPIPPHVPSLEALECPPALHAIADLQWGLVILCGATGSGKSTTLAALVDHINHRRRQHILMFEDPIEFLHRSHGCLVHQCLLTAGCEQALLRSALRCDPDVLVIGEIRDAGTVRLALAAAQSGHLVLATLHAPAAAAAIERLVDMFAPEEKDIVRGALSESLRAVAAQRLLRRAGGRGRIAQREILVTTPAVARLIREHRTAQLEHVMQTGAEYGMTTFAQSRQALLARGAIAA